MSGYTVKILNRDIETLQWLAARGYDGGFLDLAEEDENDGVTTTFVVEEHKAWEFSANVDEDRFAFLTCNGSDTLADALRGFWNEIV